jgi:predicted TIM-barrel fold metal-dependent hydrolase
MPALTLFDCNVTVGSRTISRPENDLSPEQILAEFDHAGVSAGLAFHGHARDYAPRIGNERISALAAQHSRFLPCYVLLPHHTGEFPTGDALLRYLEDGGARAVRLFPNEHNFGLGETWCGDLYSTLEEAGVPLLLDFEQTSWQEVDEILSAHPALNLLLLRVGYRIDRWVHALLDQHPGLRLEPALYPLYCGIETIAEKYGADRLIFGSGLPEWDAGSAISHLQYARIDDEARCSIAGENLKSILWKETAPAFLPSVGESPERDSIWSRVQTGQSLDDVHIVDVHAHMGPWCNFHIPGNPWADGMVEAMDACGIDQVIVAPHVGIGPDMVEGNELAADAIARFPDRIFAYCTISPHYPAAEIVAELEKYRENDGFRGIKIHPVTHDYPADGEFYTPMWEFADANRLPVLIHTWEGDSRCTPSLFGPIGEKFPNAGIILGHSGATPAGIRESIETAGKTPNIYLDLTKSLMYRGMVELMVEGVGADRVLFGTDIPFIGNTGQIGHVAAARLSEEDKRKIFSLNTRQLFGL